MSLAIADPRAQDSLGGSGPVYSTGPPAGVVSKWYSYRATICLLVWYSVTHTVLVLRPAWQLCMVGVQDPGQLQHRDFSTRARDAQLQ